MKNQQNFLQNHILFVLPLLFMVVNSLLPLHAAGNEPNYKTYINDRFGYKVDYPAFLKPQGEPTNNDGQVFLSKSGDAEMRAYGGYLVAFTFDEEYNKALTDNWEQKGKAIVTYKARGKDWFVISGTIAKKIFYRKSFCKKDTMRTVTFLYPTLEKATFNKVVGQVVSSFKWCAAEAQ
jgi:hypothetical protein